MADWEWPRVFWIENSAYINRGIIEDLDSALRLQLDPLLNLYLDQLESNSSYICIESRGNTVLSEIPPASDETLAAAIEKYLSGRGFLATKRVIAMNSSSYMVEEFKTWRRKYGVAVFENVQECKAYLQEVGAL